MLGGEATEEFWVGGLGDGALEECWSRGTGSDEDRCSGFVDMRRRNNDGDARLPGTGSPSWVGSSVSEDGKANRGCLRSSNGETFDPELVFDVVRCQVNGSRGGGIGGGIRPILEDSLRGSSVVWCSGTAVS